MLKKININRRVLPEYLWITLGIIVLITAILDTIKLSSFRTTLPLFVIAIVCFLMYFVRYFLRKNNK